jgi:glycosyltransferase involved in cell wall biosynthesis
MWRMARSARAAGYDVQIYARWFPGLAFEEMRDGFPVARVPWDPFLALPGLRWMGRRRLRQLRIRAASGREAGGLERLIQQPGQSTSPVAAPREATGRFEGAASSDWPTSLVRRLRAIPRRSARAAYGVGYEAARAGVRALPRWISFPLFWRGWARAVEDVAGPADIWHGMWIASLPAVVRAKSRFGGVGLYDSRDVFFESRDWPNVGRVRRALLAAVERGWAHSCAAVLTVNDAYAEMLEKNLGVARPVVVMNCPERYEPPEPPPDLIRERLGLPPGTAVVLYQGGLLTERGIEETMEAIRDLPEAVLVLMGYGGMRDAYSEQAAREPYVGKVFVLDAVPPEELLAWTASSDLSVMAIQPTTLNHRYTTPQKLFESLAAGVPVVASDLPGMAAIVRETRTGVLCDPTSSVAIAEAIRSLLRLSPDERREMRRRCLAAAHARYNWESQAGTLLELYARIAPSAGV